VMIIDDMMNVTLLWMVSHAYHKDCHQRVPHLIGELQLLDDVDITDGHHVTVIIKLVIGVVILVPLPVARFRLALPPPTLVRTGELHRHLVIIIIISSSSSSSSSSSIVIIITVVVVVVTNTTTIIIIRQGPTHLHLLGKRLSEVGVSLEAAAEEEGLLLQRVGLMLLLMLILIQIIILMMITYIRIIILMILMIIIHP
jgi:hypothetical protein